jgi:hypothetical protein
MGLQRIGDHDMPGLMNALSAWLDGNLLERRAAVAGLCEPRLLKSESVAKDVLKYLEQITASLANEPNRKCEAFRVLRRALGYCWSVAVVAAPVPGKRLLARFAKTSDPDVRWIVRENVKKQRLRRMVPAWPELLAASLK